MKSEETSEDGNVGGIPGGPAAPAFAKPTARPAPAGRNAPRHPRPYGTTTPSVTGNSFNAELLCLIANVNSLVLDFIARQKVGGTNLNFFIVKQFQVLKPSDYDAWTGQLPGENIKSYISALCVNLLASSTLSIPPFFRHILFNQ